MQVNKTKTQLHTALPRGAAKRRAGHRTGLRAGQGSKMPQTAAAAGAFWPGGGGRPREGAVQHSTPAIRSALALHQRPLQNLSQPSPTIYFLLVLKNTAGTRGREEVMCAFCVTEHYFFTFPKKISPPNIYQPIPTSSICQFPKSEIAPPLQMH